ncbi:MAG: hemolysin [Thermoplasmata archaeon]|nr:hemolysin [Thermoplasmata archaeon]
MPVAREEAFSFWTHALGAGLGLVGAALLTSRVSGPLAVAAMLVYGATLVLMLASSALHHVVRSEAGWTRRLDHVAIYFFIAGTYTPFCLVALPGVAARWLLTLVWALALAGVALKVFRPFAPRWITVALYVALGWSGILGAKTIVTGLPAASLAALVLGGATYTLGAIVYARRRPDPWPSRVGFHGLWHVFVLVGAALQYASVWLAVRAL